MIWLNLCNNVVMLHSNNLVGRSLVNSILMNMAQGDKRFNILTLCDPNSKICYENSIKVNIS